MRRVGTAWLIAGLVLATAGVTSALAGWSSFSGGGDSSDSKDPATVKKSFARPAALPASANATPAQIRLGKTLFFDKRISSKGDVACASCHLPDHGWADGKVWPSDDPGAHYSRRTLPLVNLAVSMTFFWDGSAKKLEDAIPAFFTRPTMLAMPADHLGARFHEMPGYKALFDAAYPGAPLDITTATKAIAAFERSLVSGTAPFDDWIAGKEDAIGADAKRGFTLFTGKANCNYCHTGWTFSDGSFQDIGLADTNGDIGRGKLFPKSTPAQYAFRTSPLRDVAIRAPYMHDGSLKTLEDVIEEYATGGVNRPSRSDDIKPLKLTAGDKKDLVAFLQTLTSRPQPFDVPSPP